MFGLISRYGRMSGMTPWQWAISLRFARMAALTALTLSLHSGPRRRAAKLGRDQGRRGPRRTQAACDGGRLMRMKRT